jgi:predicted MFS family arabinose efflux permease
MPIIIASVVLYGFSIGLFIPSNTNRVMLFASVGKKGSVSSLMITVIRAGSAFGVSFFGVIFSAFVPQKDPVQEQVPVSIINTGFKYAFLFGLVVALSGLIVSLLIKNNFKNEILQSV